MYKAKHLSCVIYQAFKNLLCQTACSVASAVTLFWQLSGVSGHR